MPAVIVFGAQWGDEGEGKATDQLGQHTGLIVKFNGGNNTGHTVVIDGGKYALYLSPARILSEGITPIVGNGVIVDPDVFFEEFAGTTVRGVDCSRLLISSNAHIVPPYSHPMDRTNEHARGNNLIGTTGQGIGPTHAGEMNRVSLRIQDLFHLEELRAKVEAALAPKSTIFETVDLEVLDPIEISGHLLSFADRIRPMLCDVSLVVNDALDRGDTVLFEDNQATMLDIDHGIYPFVTSSNSTAGDTLTSFGVGPTHIDRIIGVAKAYTTRVSEGLFPAELDGEIGKALRTKGDEFGVTADRSCRTGWFDTVIMHYSTRINDLTDIRLTRLDMLSSYETTPVCMAYGVDGMHIREMPPNQAGFEAAVPVCEELPGWSEGTLQCRSFDELSQTTRDYIKRLEELPRYRIQFVGVGPGHEAMTMRYPPI